MRNSFEFVIVGPPFSVDMAKKQSKKHNEWKAAVGRAAMAQWLWDGRARETLPLRQPIERVITSFYTTLRRDVDNIVKPILDDMKNVIYADDGEIYRLTPQRVDLKMAAIALGHNAILLTRNNGDFRKVSNLVVEDWLADEPEG